MEECKRCNASGYRHDECNTCGRDGYVDDPSDGGYMSCPECYGDSAEECQECENGYVYPE